MYSFRHSYAIRRITITNGNVFDVMKEMGDTNTKTTMGYLRFPLERRLYDFPSLREYIDQPINMQDGNKKMGTKRWEQKDGNAIFKSL